MVCWKLSPNAPLEDRNAPPASPRPLLACSKERGLSPRNPVDLPKKGLKRTLLFGVSKLAWLNNCEGLQVQLQQEALRKTKFLEHR